jgi:hypothetical protein
VIESPDLGPIPEFGRRAGLLGKEPKSPSLPGSKHTSDNLKAQANSGPRAGSKSPALKVVHTLSGEQTHDPKSPKANPGSPKQNPKSPKANPGSPKQNQKSQKANPSSAKQNPKSPKANPSSAKQNPKSPTANPSSPTQNPKLAKQNPESPKPKVSSAKGPKQKTHKGASESNGPVPQKKETELVADLRSDLPAAVPRRTKDQRPLPEPILAAKQSNASQYLLVVYTIVIVIFAVVFKVCLPSGPAPSILPDNALDVDAAFENRTPGRRGQTRTGN